MNYYTRLTEDQVDEIYPPFSEKRRAIRQVWDRMDEHINWDKFLHSEALKLHKTNFFIMMNHRIDNEKFNYVLYDIDEQTKSYIDTTIERIKKLALELGSQSISPIETMKYSHFKEVGLGMFVPLPF